MSDHEFNDEYEEPDSEDSSVSLKTYALIHENSLYPLQNNWVMYDHTKSNSGSYESSTRKVCEFGTVIKFWQIFNSYPGPKQLFSNKNYKPSMSGREISSISVFKKGILPKWEDPINKYGAEISKRRFGKKDTLDELDTNWNDLLIACISSMFDPSVTGIRVVDSSNTKNADEFRLLYKIELWFDDIKKKTIIEEKFKNLLGLEDKVIHYKEHNLNV